MSTKSEHNTGAATDAKRVGEAIALGRILNPHKLWKLAPRALAGGRCNHETHRLTHTESQ